jgi:MoxR-like ATPase
MGDFLYIPTDPVVIMQANAAMKDMGRVTIISALLLDGPPGVGKSYLGQYLQFLLKAELIRYQMVPGTSRDDILFDRTVLTPDGRPTDGVILQAMKRSQAAKVVLILEELDKAQRDVDALLLSFLQEGELWFPQIGTVKANQENLLVVITKNDTREAMAPLLRRCRVAEMTWPSIESEIMIMRAYWDLLTEQEAAKFLELPRWLRTLPVIRKAPSINEVVRLLGDLLYLLPRTDELNIGRYCVQALAVYAEDRRILLKERSPTYLGKFMKEFLTPVLVRYEEVKPLIEIPSPTAIINEYKARHHSSPIH